MRLLLRIAGLAALAMMCVSLLGVYIALTGDGVEISASVAYALEPTETTKRASEEAFAMAKQRRWRGVLFFGCCFAVSGAVVALIIKRLDAQTHLTRRCS